MSSTEIKQRSKAGVSATGSTRRWAVILAGGEGTRLRGLTRMLTGDERPKQFCSLFGRDTLLDQTRKRVALKVAQDRTLFVLTHTHEPFYAPLLNDVPPSRLLVQPRNQGTASAILYSLLSIEQRNPNAVVAFFPSDHYFSFEERFMSYVERAFSAIELQPHKLVLLGITPSSAEAGYGWIAREPADEHTSGSISAVRKFAEKPAPDVAAKLLQDGALWNSFVMVGRVSSFLETIGRAIPKMCEEFNSIQSTLGNDDESDALAELYDRICPMDFSREVLARQTDDLLALTVSNVGWDDCGETTRVLSMAKRGVQLAAPVLAIAFAQNA